jgi:hypothetical protein
MVPGRQGKLNGFTAYKGFSGSTIFTANPADTAAPGQPTPDQPVSRSADPVSGSCDPVFKTGGAGPGDRIFTAWMRFRQRLLKRGLPPRH